MAGAVAVDIANLALASLGEAPMLSDSDDTPAADIIRSQWDLTRRAELSAHPWIFATATAQLAADADKPLQWQKAYSLPADNLRLLELVDTGVFFDWPGYWGMGRVSSTSEPPPFELAGGKILCNLSAPITIRYVRDLEEPPRWHPLFSRALGYALAIILAESITQSRSRKVDAKAAYDEAIKQAKRQNAIQKPPRFLRTVSPWLGIGGQF